MLFVVGAIGIMWYYQPAESSIFSEEPQEAVPVSALSAATTVIASMPMCGDGKCESPETMTSCLADCPGVTTEAMCGEEPHSDPGGYAVVWGAGHLRVSASECCAACAAHAANPKNAKRPCNRSRQGSNSDALAVDCSLPHLVAPVMLLVPCADRQHAFRLSPLQLGILPFVSAVLVSRYGQLAWLWRVLAQVAARHKASALWSAWQVLRRVPQEALECAHDGAQPRRDEAQSNGADARSLDWRCDGHNVRPDDQMDDGPRRDELEQRRADCAVASLGDARGEPCPRRNTGKYGKRMGVEVN